jgi:hypothetical protein
MRPNLAVGLTMAPGVGRIAHSILALWDLDPPRG